MSHSGELRIGQDCCENCKDLVLELKLYKIAYCSSTQDRRSLAVQLSKLNRCGVNRESALLDLPVSSHTNSEVVDLPGLGYVQSWYASTEIRLLAIENAKLKEKLKVMERMGSFGAPDAGTANSLVRG